MWFYLFASIGGFSAIALDAFVSHGHWIQPEALAQVKTAIQYQLIHSVVLLIIGLLYYTYRNKLLIAAGVLFFLGILGFSVGIYLKLIAQINLVSSVIPLGGSCLMVAWFTLFLFAIIPIKNTFHVKR